MGEATLDARPVPAWLRPGQEVSCRATAPLIKAALDEGIPLDALMEGLESPASVMRDTSKRVPWRDLRRLLSNLGRYWDQPRFEAFGSLWFGGPEIRVFRAIAGAFIRPADLMRWTSRPGLGSGAQLFSCITGEVQEPSPNLVELRLGMVRGYPASVEYFWITRGVMRRLPELVGGRVISCELDLHADSARYLIQLEARRKLLDRIGFRLAGPLRMRAAAVELREASELLQARYDELQIRNAQLERAQAALRETEANYRSLVDMAPEAIVSLDPTSLRILDANPAAEALFGASRTSLRRQDLPALAASDDGAARWSDRARRALSEGPQVFTDVLEGPDGDFIGEVRLTNAATGGATILRASIVDVSERQRLHAETARARDYFEAIINAVPDPIFVKAENQQLITVNDAFCTFVDRPREALIGALEAEYLPRVVARILHHEDGALFQLGGTVESELTMELGGAERLVSVKRAVHQGPDGRRFLVATIRDLTERQRIERSLQQAQKLESLGVLAGGLAHDFNNLLVAVLGQAQVAEAQLEASHAVRRPLERIRQAASRAADLTRQMLAYSGGGSSEWRKVRLDELVEENAELLRGAMPKEVELTLDLDADVPAVEGDPAQLQQVLMNLVLNGAEAIDEGPGRISVRVSLLELENDARDAALHGMTLHAGPHVCLEVVDTGAGMDDATREQIFDPFFTTKFTGRGLGLAAVLGILRSHHAAVEVDSNPGAGARFRVYFPAATASALAARPTPTEAPVDRGPAVILVVDDEPMVLETAADMLRSRGHEPICADGGEASLREIERAADRIDLVLLDMSMPGMSGAEVLSRLRERAPEIPVVLTSGFTEDEALRRYAVQAEGFLQKPYAMGELERSIGRHARHRASSTEKAS